MSLSEMLLPEYDQETATSRKVLERVPADKFAWKPHEKSMPLGRLATHIAELPGWVAPTLAETELDIGDFEPVVAGSKQELLEMFDANVAAGRAALAAASDEDFGVVWTLKAGDEVFFQMPRAAVLRSMVFNHLVHHRAQLGVYLRLNDLPVPSVYGPSADEGP